MGRHVPIARFFSQLLGYWVVTIIRFEGEELFDKVQGERSKEKGP